MELSLGERSRWDCGRGAALLGLNVGTKVLGLSGGYDSVISVGVKLLGLVGLSL